MTVYEGSRYEGLPIVRTRAADGRTYPTLFGPVVQIQGTLRYRSHVVEAGERFDTIAYRLWGDPELWWRIAHLNPEIFHPEEIPVGAVIRLPVV